MGNSARILLPGRDGALGQPRSQPKRATTPTEPGAGRAPRCTAALAAPAARPAPGPRPPRSRPRRADPTRTSSTGSAPSRSRRALRSRYRPCPVEPDRSSSQEPIEAGPPAERSPPSAAGTPAQHDREPSPRQVTHVRQHALPSSAAAPAASATARAEARGAGQTQPPPTRGRHANTRCSIGSRPMRTITRYATTQQPHRQDRRAPAAVSYAADGLRAGEPACRAAARARRRRAGAVDRPGLPRPSSPRVRLSSRRKPDNVRSSPAEIVAADLPRHPQRLDDPVSDRIRERRLEPVQAVGPNRPLAR